MQYCTGYYFEINTIDIHREKRCEKTDYTQQVKRIDYIDVLYKLFSFCFVILFQQSN